MSPFGELETFGVFPFPGMIPSATCSRGARFGIRSRIDIPVVRQIYADGFPFVRKLPSVVEEHPFRTLSPLGHYHCSTPRAHQRAAGDEPFDCFHISFFYFLGKRVSNQLQCFLSKAHWLAKTKIQISFLTAKSFRYKLSHARRPCGKPILHFTDVFFPRHS